MRLTRLVPVALLALTGCSSHPGGPAGSAVTGALDTHCEGDGGMIVQPTNPAVCHLTPDGGADTTDYGDTLYNQEGDDDDCKYHMKWTVSPVYENYDVNFTLTVTKRTDGSAAGGANPLVEAYLSDTHPAPNTNQVAKEGPTGTYKIGPLRFDAPGRWTVRFHVYEDCYDANPASQHGHAAFYLDVP